MYIHIHICMHVYVYIYIHTNSYIPTCTYMAMWDPETQCLFVVYIHTYIHTYIQGTVVMTPDLEDVFICLFDGRIPSSWLKGYPSLKPLASWARDLVERIKQLAEWSEGTYPVIYNMGYFTFPTGFLTAVLQTSARKNSVSIDVLAVSDYIHTHLMHTCIHLDVYTLGVSVVKYPRYYIITQRFIKVEYSLLLSILIKFV